MDQHNRHDDLPPAVASRSDTGPFVIVPTWLLDSGASPRALQLYLALSRYADYESGEAWPTRKRLAADLDCDTRTIDRSTKELVDVGALEVHAQFDEAGDRTANLYKVRRVSPGGDTDEGTGGVMDVAVEREPVLTREETTDVVSSVGVETIDRKISVDDIYQHWRQARGKSRRSYDKISPARRQKILARLKEFPPEDLHKAIDGVAHDPWEDRPLHDDLTVIFRSREQVEKFIEFSERGPPRSRGLTPEDISALADEAGRRGL